MAGDADLDVKIKGIFTGKKAFKEAETATQKLGGNVKKLAGAMGLAYSATRVIAYGKAAMKAAADDQRAQKILSNNLKNLGLSYAAVGAESFIQKMETQTAILDDELRPAYTKLASVTGSTAKTQNLMSLAFDASSSTGLSYVQTVDILSKAYVGNTKGLKKLNLGLTEAEMKAMSFNEIADKMRANFAGAGATSLDTYAGSMAKLSVATSNASETIGGALLNSIIAVSGSNGIDGLISKINTVANAFAGAITQIGGFASALNGSQSAKAFSTGYNIGGKGVTSGSVFRPKGMGNVAMTGGSNMDLQVSSKLAKDKAEKAALARAKELANIGKTSVKVNKESLKLAKAKATFDLQKIQIEAALKGKISDEEKARLLLLKAIENENVGDIDKYTKALAAAQAETAKLQANLDAIKAKAFVNPFTDWTSGLTSAQLALERFKESGRFKFANPYADWTSGLTAEQLRLERLRESGRVSEGANTSTNTGTNVNVNVNVAGTVTSETDLTTKIVEVINQQSWAGVEVAWNRAAKEAVV